MKLVVDASVALKWILNDPAREPDTAAALVILEGVVTGKHRLFAPAHAIGEVLAVVARQSLNSALGALSQMRALNAETVDDDAVYQRAAELSHRLKHHLFDTLYHAVAREKGATLVTADDRYFGVAKQDGAIQRLSNFSLI
jgi:predicted nucleic acid-binding protein